MKTCSVQTGVGLAQLVPCILLLLSGGVSGRAQILTTLYSFDNGHDGGLPQAGLIQANDGKFYGTAFEGGNGGGTIFRITGDGKLTTLYSFCSSARDAYGECLDGTGPNALALGRDGNFYGTTLNCCGVGNAFRITPSGSFSNLYIFCNVANQVGGCGDGYYPSALAQGADGNFYGTTDGGGENSPVFLGNSFGTVFRITPDGALTTIYTFTDGLDGAVPQAALVEGNDGNFYGTAYQGGRTNLYFGTTGLGTVFKISPTGSLTPLYAFSGGIDGAFPLAGLVQGTDGNFYGTTYEGGLVNVNGGFGFGTIFRISPAGDFQSLYTFRGGSDGAFPSAALVQGSDGSFYGTAYYGGDLSLNGGNGLGTIFQITPGGQFTTLHTFKGSDGANPAGPLTQGSDGNFYGTTSLGGKQGLGTIFKLAPPQTHDTVADLAAQLQPLGRLDGTADLDLVFSLPLRNQAELTRLLEELYDPASANYHHYLTPGQFTAAFGPSEEDYQAVIAFAQNNGLAVTTTHPNRTLLHVRGKVTDIEKALQVKMQVYQHRSEARTFYAADSQPSVATPATLLEIHGLNNYLLPQRASSRPAPLQPGLGRSAQGSAPGGLYSPSDLRTAYVPGVTLTGKGQKIGLFELDGYFESDIAAFEQQFGLRHVPLQTVHVDGFGGPPGLGYGEVEMDIELVLGFATGLSQIIVYEAPSVGVQAFLDLLNRMATDNQAAQLSCSWIEGGPIATANQIFWQMAAQGQTFFQGAGDWGAYAGDWSASSPGIVPFPVDNPFITTTAATFLTTSAPGGPWQSETAVSLDVDGFLNGGGISSVFPIPDWQTGISMSLNMGSTTMRNVPDVSMVGDFIYTIILGQPSLGGGTSATAPLWAAFTAMVNEQAAMNHQPRVGCLNPALYAIGKGPNCAECFHDITIGNNTNASSGGLFLAVPGYDLCTGWGSPTGSNLINALAPPRR